MEEEEEDRKREGSRYSLLKGGQKYCATTKDGGEGRVEEEREKRRKGERHMNSTTYSTLTNTPTHAVINMMLASTSKF